MKRKILLAVFLLLVVAGVVGYAIVFKSRSDVSQGKPDVAVSATDLVAAFEKDTAAAGKTYLGKVVEVTGRVKRIDTAGAVVLGEENSMSEVAVGLDKKYHAADFQKLKEGATAVLQGVCSGYENSGTDPNDLLSGLGTTVQLTSAGVKSKE